MVKAKPGAEVLAVHEAARNQFGRIPLLVTRAAGNGKVLYMGTDSAWRWRKGVEDTYHYRFWGQVVRWMAHQRHLSQDEGVRFFYTPETPKRGDKVRLNATVLDKLGIPISEGKVAVTLTAPSGTSETIELAAENAEWGVHTGQFVPREGGKYEVEVKSESAGRRLKTQLTVTVPTLEKVGPPAKLDVLREIAALTAGKQRRPGRSRADGQRPEPAAGAQAGGAALPAVVRSVVVRGAARAVHALLDRAEDRRADVSAACQGCPCATRFSK